MILLIFFERRTFLIDSTSSYFDYTLEPRRAILFQDVKSNYASIECVHRNVNPLTTSLCVMSRADNSNGLTLASIPTFKKVFGMKNVSRAGSVAKFENQTRPL